MTIPSERPRRKSIQAKNNSLNPLQKVAQRADLPKNFFRAALAVAMASLPLKITKDAPLLGRSPRSSNNDSMMKSTLPKIKRETDFTREEKEAIQAWDLAPEFLDEAFGFYESLYGENMTELPYELEISEEYLHEDPIEVVKAYDDLVMTHVDTALCWVARMYLCMPLPPEYFRVENSEGVFYIHKVRLVRLPLHPGVGYLKDIVRRVRKHLPPTETFEQTIHRYQVFFDEFNKEVKVDMLLMRLTVEENTNKYFYYSNKLVSEQENLVESKVEVEEGQENTEPLLSKTKLTDFMIFDVCKQVEIDRTQDPHLTGFVAAFMLEKEETNKEWEWRSPTPHKYFWVNTVVKRAQTEYPFLEELMAALIIHKEELKKLLERENNLRDTVKLGFAFRKPDMEEVKNSIAKERIEIMNRMIVKRTQNLKDIKILRKADHLGSLISPQEKLKSAKRSRKPSFNEDSFNQPDSPSKISKKSPMKPGSNFASQLMLKKEEENKISKENEKEKETRKLIKELNSILGEDIIVKISNQG